MSAFVLEAGGNVGIAASSTDPGSDDLTFTWAWGDNTTSSQTSLVNPPATDPPKSPSVQPRDVSLSESHTYGSACLYDLTVGVEDDDGGSASDSGVVVVVGNADRSRGSGYWLNQMRTKRGNDFSDAQLDCYLKIVNYFSLTFEGVNRPGAAAILHLPAKPAAQTEFDQQAMAAWLNFTNGAVSLDTLVDTTGDLTVEGPAVQLVRVNDAIESGQREWEVRAVAVGRAVVRGTGTAQFVLTFDVSP